MRERKFRKSGRCERCGEKYRVRGDVDDHCSQNYKQWMDHNREVQNTGMGVEVCWHCFRYGSNPSIKDAFNEESKPEHQVTSPPT